MAQTPIDKTLELAVEHHTAGRIQQAEPLYRQVLASNPLDAKVLYRLGFLLYQTGRHQDAAVFMQRAVSVAPDTWRYQWGLGIVQAALGRWIEAIAAYEQAAKLNPDCVEILAVWGTALHSIGRIPEALSKYQRIFELDPKHPENLNNYGSALFAIGEYIKAVEILNQAIAVCPTNEAAHLNLGNALGAQRRYTEAITSIRKCLQLKPDHPEAWYNLGNTLRSSGEFAQAIDAYRQCLILCPSHAKAHVNLGNTLGAIGEFKQAAEFYLQALTHDPHLTDAYINLGGVLRTMGAMDQSIQALRHALSRQPDSNKAYCNLGNVAKDTGDLNEAIACYRRAVELRPADSISHSNLAYTLTFHPDYDSTAILHENLRWNALHASRVNSEIRPHDNDRSPQRRLRVGYVSPDFREHCQSFFTLALLPNHDHANFEIYCYASAARGDAITERIKSCADVWRNMSGQSDAEVADQIRADKIDILIDLTMHMSNGRPLTFARKPAPVQVAWLAYPGTTGMPSIDYRITDPYLDPPGDSDLAYSEKSVRLPDTFWCYDPLATEPTPNALPALANGYITFGCLNNFCKVTDGTLDLWGQVMSKVAGSRLMLLCADGKHRQRVFDRLGKFGVEPARIEFLEFRPRAKYLLEYHRIDLGLDSIPYNGHTTSLDSLWMGIPVVTRLGKTVVGRAGWSQLCNLDLRELAAHNDEEFVQIAAELAGDLPRLGQLRSTLRARMAASALMDGPRFARNMESAYRQMWRDWCSDAKKS